MNPLYSKKNKKISDKIRRRPFYFFTHRYLVFIHVFLSPAIFFFYNPSPDVLNEKFVKKKFFIEFRPKNGSCTVLRKKNFFFSSDHQSSTSLWLSTLTLNANINDLLIIKFFFLEKTGNLWQRKKVNNWNQLVSVLCQTKSMIQVRR